MRPGPRSETAGPKGAGAEGATVHLLARVLPGASAGREWFAVPMPDGAVEVSVARPPLEPLVRFRELVALGYGVESVGAPSVFDPSLFPDGDPWDGLPRLLCGATAAAVKVLDGRRSFCAVEQREVATSVREVVCLAGRHRSGEMLLAATDWLQRVAARAAGRVPPAGLVGPAEAIVVAGARAAHIHVVQLCGPEPSVERLRAEIDLLRRLIDPATT